MSSRFFKVADKWIEDYVVHHSPKEAFIHALKIRDYIQLSHEECNQLQQKWGDKLDVDIHKYWAKL